MSWNHMLRKAWTISVVITLWLAGTARAATLYVDAAVATTGDGSRAAPFQTIGEAIAASALGDEIRIAGGIYDNEPADMGIKGDQIISGSYDRSFTTSERSATPTIIDMAHLTQQEQDRTFRCRGTTSFTLENLVIQNSTTGEWDNTDNGGAMYIQNGSSGVIRGVSFINCATKFEGGAENGPAREGGAVCIRDGSAVTFEDCVFDSCTAVGGGGAVRMRNAGSGNNVKFHRCLFTNCGARREGSVIDDGDGGSQVEIVNCIFAHNGVEVDIPSGTAPSHYLIRVADRRALIYNCTFVGNNNPDGYMFNLGNSSDAAAAKQIVNCLVAHNTIASGGATFAIFNYASGYDDATTLQNNLFFSNSGLDPLDPAGANLIGANGNLAGEPQFTDAENGDYHLEAGSPGEDAGQTLALVPDDFAGTARPVGAAYDIGALEGQAPAEPLFYKVPSVLATASSWQAGFGPEKTVDGSGLDEHDGHSTAAKDMWQSAAGAAEPVWIQYEFDKVYRLHQLRVWNYNGDQEYWAGFGLKQVTVRYSLDGAEWAVLGEFLFEQGTSTEGYQANTVVDLTGVAARYVQLVAQSSWGSSPRHGLSEVRFLYIPVSARDPEPASGAIGVPLDATLSWKAGREAASHEVHLDTDMQAVIDSTTPVDVVSEAMYAPADLQLDTTYYWKVVEVNQAESPSAWAGDVWSFSTTPYVVVDDFERYTNNFEAGEAVFNTWLDGWTDPAYGGSQVGNVDAPYCERTIVHGGRQSMPFTYDNTATFSFSEAVRPFDTPQDWTRGGIQTLVLFFRGESTNVSGALYVKINGAKLPYTGNAGDLTLTQWKQWDIELPSAAGLGAVRTLTIGVSGGQGKLYIDDIRLYRSAPAVNP